MQVVGEAVGLREAGRTSAAGLRSRLADCRSQVQLLGGSAPLGRVAFLEWTDPLFPGGHWTPQLITLAGGSHPLNLPSM